MGRGNRKKNKKGNGNVAVLDMSDDVSQKQVDCEGDFYFKTTKSKKTKPVINSNLMSDIPIKEKSSSKFLDLDSTQNKNTIPKLKLNLNSPTTFDIDMDMDMNMDNNNNYDSFKNNELDINNLDKMGYISNFVHNFWDRIYVSEDIDEIIMDDERDNDLEDLYDEY